MDAASRTFHEATAYAPGRKRPLLSDDGGLPSFGSFLRPNAQLRPAYERPGSLSAPPAAPVYRPSYNEGYYPVYRHEADRRSYEEYAAQRPHVQYTPPSQSHGYHPRRESLGVSSLRPPMPASISSRSPSPRYDSSSPVSDGSSAREESHGSPTAAADGTRPARTSRYLREVDRRNILQRIKNGEKQADLAKEYQVSRAAISNLKQRRKLKEHQEQETVVVERENPRPTHEAPRHIYTPSASMTHSHHSPEAVMPPRMYSYAERPSYPVSSVPHFPVKARRTDSWSSPRMEPRSHPAEIQLASMARLLSQLHDAHMTDASLRLVIQRITRLLLEEALGRVHPNKPVCAVALDERGQFLLHEFQLLEGTNAVGQLQTHYDNEQDHLRAAFVHKPAQLTMSSVLVLDTHCTTHGRELISAIQTLLDAGVNESDISIVTLFSHTRGLDRIQSAFPRVQLLTAKLEEPETELSAMLQQRLRLRDVVPATSPSGTAH
ncbi:hypothetical protein Poli38472_010984 [Pythium oligandrum]|uniref:Phosphoribosyltransferase domain-containing protein n=1 Tax=Pythium oligandrum TaxID=41045 RepID=A0A8K1FGQ7_PYTOL|nr:hypothetical protein Poli38472_010984 [Pythium oligandrum]|eukprot:TMW61921.1 hypothetical protein Poli38472_010984 [Pythium oligandrum]